MPRSSASIVAGALGAGVASRLDPYGADDPATESVQADERLEDAGYQRARADRAGPGRGRLLARRPSAGSSRSPRGSPTTPPSAGSPATTPPAPGTSSPRDGRSTYLAVDLKPTDDKERQDAAKRIADRLRRRSRASPSAAPRSPRSR